MARMEIECILKKNEVTFFKFIASVLENSTKLSLWFIFSLKIHLISSSLCFISISCTTKVVLIWDSFDQKTSKSSAMTKLLLRSGRLVTTTTRRSIWTSRLKWHHLKTCKIFFSILSHESNFIDDVEFLVLFDLFQAKNPDFPYQDYPNFARD